jgi:predicted nucleic acid-binding protein
MSGLLLDSCVLIDYLRNRPSAIDFLDRLTERVAVSVITTAELYAGVRDGAEETRVDGLLTRVLVRDVDLTIARLAGRFRREYRQRHGVAIPDALIAATAEVHGARLVTRNARHFPMLADVLVPYP